MKEEKIEKKEKEHKPKMRREEKKDERALIRILGTDIHTDKKIFAGLCEIKGISWSLSNALCHSLNIDKNKKIKDLSEKEMEDVTNFFKDPKIPSFILNRRNDRETGEDSHLIGSDLDLKKEFDIKRLKKIRAYKGIRHSTGQPVRGQRTRSHFRKNKSVGVAKKKK